MLYTEMVNSHADQWSSPQPQLAYLSDGADYVALKVPDSKLYCFGRKTLDEITTGLPPISEHDDQILNLKSFKQKGNFKGFAEDVKQIIGVS